METICFRRDEPPPAISTADEAQRTIRIGSVVIPGVAFSALRIGRHPDHRWPLPLVDGRPRPDLIEPINIALIEATKTVFGEEAPRATLERVFDLRPESSRRWFRLTHTPPARILAWMAYLSAQPNARHLGEALRIATIIAEAREKGLLPDQAFGAVRVAASILRTLDRERDIVSPVKEEGPSEG